MTLSVYISKTHLNIVLYLIYGIQRLRLTFLPLTFQTVAPWERRGFPLAEDPEPEPEVEHHVRPRMRSISGCRAAVYGRLDSDDTEPQCEEDSGPKNKGPAYR